MKLIFYTVEMISHLDFLSFWTSKASVFLLNVSHSGVTWGLQLNMEDRCICFTLKMPVRWQHWCKHSINMRTKGEGKEIQRQRCHNKLGRPEVGGGMAKPWKDWLSLSHDAGGERWDPDISPLEGSRVDKVETVKPREEQEDGTWGRDRVYLLP